jgi:hypothetical protein
LPLRACEFCCVWRATNGGEETHAGQVDDDRRDWAERGRMLDLASGRGIDVLTWSPDGNGFGPGHRLGYSAVAALASRWSGLSHGSGRGGRT